MFFFTWFEMVGGLVLLQIILFMSRSKKRFINCIFPRRNSFLMGAASVLNLAGNHRRYTYAETAEEADAKALAKIWEEVGQDLRFFMQMPPAKKNKTVKKS